MRGRLLGSCGWAALASLVLASGVAAQQGTVTGRVTDAETGRPVADVSVQVVGGAQVGSDAAGRFSLTLAPGTYSFVFERIGYETKRMNGVSVHAGQTTTLAVDLATQAFSLGGMTVSVTSRGREEKALDAPASVSVVNADLIQERAATTPVEYVKALPGVDVVQTGLTQSNTVTRGFNNVFSGALLVLVDNRYAHVPSLRINAYNMIPTTTLDIERIEVLLGPAAALYGPNSASGVMHIITTSPIDKPGTAFSLSGGERSVFQGAFRQAWKFSDKAGLKVSAQYFRGDDWVYRDPVEESAAAQPGANPLVGARDFNAERLAARRGWTFGRGRTARSSSRTASTRSAVPSSSRASARLRPRTGGTSTGRRGSARAASSRRASSTPATRGIPICSEPASRSSTTPR